MAPESAVPESWPRPGPEDDATVVDAAPAAHELDVDVEDEDADGAVDAMDTEKPKQDLKMKRSFEHIINLSSSTHDLGDACLKYTISRGGYHKQPVGPNLYDQCVNCHQWKSCLQTEGPELFLIWNT